MRKVLVLAGVALVLAGCGEYFDRHPANIRPESEAAATVLAYRPSANARPSSGTISLAGPAPTTVRESASTAAAAPPPPANQSAAALQSGNKAPAKPPAGPPAIVAQPTQVSPPAVAAVRTA